MSNDRLSLASFASLQVLLVPVQPIKRSTYEKYASIVRSFTRIPLRDVPPDTRAVAQYQCSASPTSHGALFLRYLDNYSRSQVQLADFEISRRIVGVIGILDCEEWLEEEEGGLSDGLREFQQCLTKHPAALANRCFAFNLAPGSNEVLGSTLVGVPTVGDINFYLSTLVADFCASLLHEMSSLMIALEANPPPTSNSLPRSVSVGSNLLAASASVDDLVQRSVSTPPDAVPVSNMDSLRPFSKKAAGRNQKHRADLKALAGRWEEAQSLYTEAISACKIQFDDLYQASAIEGSCAMTVLQCWQATHNESIPVFSAPKVELTALTAPTTTVEPIKDLTASLRDIPERYSQVIALYAKNLRGSDDTDVLSPLGEPTSPQVYAEACLRAARFLLCVFRFDGWTSKSLAAMISHSLPVSNNSSSAVQRYSIAEFISLAIGPAIEQLSMPDRLAILGSAASMFQQIDYQRKRATLLREIAACVGESVRLAKIDQQKAASSKDVVKSLPNEDGNNGVIALLESVAHTYGCVVDQKAVYSDQEAPNQSTIDSLPKATHFGWPQLQVSCLTDAATTLEYLSSYASALRFLKSLMSNLAEFMLMEEQTKIANELSVLLGAANRRSSVRLGLDWWAPHDLLQSMELVRSDQSRILYETATQIRGKSAFLHTTANNPVKPQPAAVPAKDAIEIGVTLMNVFSFPLELAEVVLLTSGIDCEALPSSVLLTPNALTTIKLSVVPRDVGVLRVTGIKVRLYNSVFRRFSVTSTRFMLSSEEVNGIKKAPLPELKSKPPDLVNAAISSIEVQVVAPMPYLRLLQTDLRCGALSVIAGESAPLLISVENPSPHLIDDIQISCDDNLTTQVANRLADTDTDLPPGIAFELDLDLRTRPVITTAGPLTKIKAGKQKLLQLQVYGKPGCTEGNLQISYSSKLDNSVRAPFYRRLAVPFSLSVETALTIDSMHFRLLSNLNANQIPSESTIVDEAMAVDLRSFVPHRDCLLVLTIANCTSTVFHIVAQYTSDDCCSSAHRVIEGGNVKNIILNLRRLCLPFSSLQEPIPAPKAVERQFVLTEELKTKALEEVATEREIFWYRHELLQSLELRWRDPESGRSGEISTRHLRLTGPMLDVLRLPFIDVQVNVDHGQEQDGDIRSICGEFHTATVRCRALQGSYSSVIVNAQISAGGLPSRDCSFSGATRKVINEVSQDKDYECIFAFCFLSEGVFRLNIEVLTGSSLYNSRSLGQASINVIVTAS